MRAHVVLGVLCGTMLGCKPVDVDLAGDASGDSPFTAACTVAPSTLAHLAGIQSRMMAIDDSNLYVVASATAEASTGEDLWRIPKNGSKPQRLAASQVPIGGLDVGTHWVGSAATVYFTAGAGQVDAGSTGAVWSVGPDGPAVFAPNRLSPGACLMVADRLYWAEESLDPAGLLRGAIVSASADGGAVTTLQALDGSDLPQTFVPRYESMLLWTTADPTRDDQSEANVSGCGIPVSTGAVTQFVGPTGGGVGGLATNGWDVFFGSPNGIVDLRIADDGGLSVGQQPIATRGFVKVIAEDESGEIYFVDPATKDLDEAAATDPYDGPLSRALAANVDPATALVVDDACVYWIDTHSETVTMVLK